MSNEAAVKLAEMIRDGLYAPSTMTKCEPALTRDENPHSVRLTQFVLFAKPAQNVRSPQPPAYLILQQAQPRVPNKPHPLIDRVIKPLSQHLSDDILRAGNLPQAVSDRLPDPDDARTDVDRLRAIAVERRLRGYTAGWSDSEVRAGVGQLI